MAENIYSGYGSISGIYDKVNADIDYSAWADFIEDCFHKYSKKKPSLVLDLACGTGSMTLELARRGYDMIGIDGSEDMLAEAYNRMYDCEMSGILYLRQDMRAFELYGTVGAVTCCLDSINYLSGEGELKACFDCVHNYLDPDGIFIFDVNTPYKFENVYADNSYIHEDECDGKATLCAWQNEYDKESKLCKFYLSVFEEGEGGKYTRTDEIQTERCFDSLELKVALESSGFEVLGVFGGYDFSEPASDCARWYIVARAKK